MDKSGIARWQRDGDPGGNDNPLTRRQHHVDRRHQISAGIARMGVGRQRELRIEPLHQDVESHVRERYSNPCPADVAPGAPTRPATSENALDDHQVGYVAAKQHTAKGPSPGKGSGAQWLRWLTVANAVDKLGWKLMGGASAAAAAGFTRKAAEKVYKAGVGEAPPENPASPHVPLRQAVLWAALSGVAVGLVRLLVERTAAAAWVRARGELPPGIAKESAKDDADND
jgi:hypothetical protein